MLTHIRPLLAWFSCCLAPSLKPQSSSSESGCAPHSSGPPSAQGPFACRGRYPRTGRPRGRLGSRYASFIAPTSPCVRPNPSRRLSANLGGRVLAGCCQALLGDGPSRHYLRHLCVGAWTYTPPCPLDAHTHFFSKGVGLTLRERRSAHETTPTGNFCRERIFEAAVIRLPSGSHAR